MEKYGEIIFFHFNQEWLCNWKSGPDFDEYDFQYKVVV
jgi:hypothetical protein